MAPRRATTATQTIDSGLEEVAALKRAVAAQGTELQQLRAELPKLQAQSERTLVAEASAHGQSLSVRQCPALALAVGLILHRLHRRAASGPVRLALPRRETGPLGACPPPRVL